MLKLFLLLTSALFCCNITKAQRIFHPYQSQIKQYVLQKKMDSRICFLLDLNIHNGKKRFFVYDIQKDSILHAGLVTHGDCRERYLSDVRYSNQPGSQCSSSGRYKVGAQYKGIFGKSYRLHGLDSSNSNARKRAVVIHSHECIPDEEIYPDQICNSQGCATVAPSFLTTISGYINQSRKPILLWVLDRR
ncbi:MAG: murein L,D-transpeptidase catalytic domain-containing protein [Bacteroidota bacterium]